MTEANQVILALGSMLLFSMIAEYIGRKTALPRVTLLIIFGLVIGHHGLDLIPTALSSQFNFIADITLIMIGFILGGQFAMEDLRQNVRKIFAVTLGAAIGSMVFVAAGLSLLSLPVSIAIMLACISSATDPAATTDVIFEEQSKTSFAQLLLSVVALDDMAGLLLFSIGLSIVSISTSANIDSPVALAFYEIGGALALGTILGIPAALLTGRIKPGKPIVTEALGLILLCGGLAKHFEVSFLLSAMMMGAVVRNLASHHDHAFHEIENIELPFMILFFVLAGATMDMGNLQSVWLIACAYIVLRLLGKVAGGYIGAWIGRTPGKERHWVGLALLPQAGVAIGMALVASHHFPEHEDVILSVVIFSTVVFEIIGPLFTRIALKYAK